MGRHQVYRGDPTQKQYYVINNFSGGMNTVAIDDNIVDYQNRELINVELEKQGLLQNRKGFGETTIFNNLLSIFEYVLPSSGLSLFKVIENTNNILENILEEKNYDYQWLEVANSDYWDDNGDEGGDYDETIATLATPPDPDDFSSALSTPEDINVAGRVYDTDTTTYYYYRSVYEFTGSLKILIIYKNYILLFEYDGTEVTYAEIKINSKRLPSVSSAYKTPLTGIDVQEFASKLYISLNDINDYYKGILVYDKDDDTWTIWRGEYFSSGSWADMDSDLLTDVYEPVPYDISTSSANVTQGFNVMAEEPLLYIGDQKTSLETIRSVILTDTSDNYINKIPLSGDFKVHIIKTGSTHFKPEEIRLVFKGEDEEPLDFTIGYDNSGTWVYGDDNGGYFTYLISDLDIGTNNFVIAYFMYNCTVVQRLDKDTTDLAAGTIGTEDGIYSPKDENVVYLLDDPGGTQFDDFTPITVDYIYETDDVNAIDPDDAGVFDYLMLSGNNGLYFQLRDANSHRLFTYQHTPSQFNEITTLTTPSTDGILYEKRSCFIPNNGTPINLSNSDTNYYMYYNLGTDFDYVTIEKYHINLENSTVVDIEGQYYNIGSSDVTLITGLDLEDVKMQIIDSKMVYYNGNTIYFSNIYQFDYVLNYAYLLLPLLSSDEIMTIKYFRGSWIIFTKYSIWKMTGTYGDSDWSVKLINNTIGCIAPNSVRSIENTLYFVSQDGLYRLKQNYYLEGLENVAKMDKNVPDLIEKESNLYSIYWNEQYILYDLNDNQYDAYRMYANIDLPENLHPFVADNFTVYPDNIFKEGWHLLSIKNNKLYQYNKGYTDFLPNSTADEDDYTYAVRVISARNNIGYPTHNKKFKSIYVKTYYNGNSILYFTALVDDFIAVDPKAYIVTANDDGELVYNEYNDPENDNNLSTELSIGELGTFELGDTPLGDSPFTTHKIVVGSKGKNIQLMIEHNSNALFGIVDIGIVYKLGKVKERG